MAEPQTRTADKKPEKYVGTDGKTHIRMVPVRKDIVKTEKTMCPQCKGKGCSHCDNTGYHESVDEVSLDAIKKAVTGKNLSKSVNKATNKDKIKMDLAALRKKLATESYSMNEMVCENCGDTYGKPKTESCMYDAYDKNGKNWVTKKEYLAAQKKNEEVELDENYRQLATKGMGTEYHPKHKFGDTTKVGRDVDYYHPKTGAKGDGKIVKTTDTHYHVKDTQSGQVHKFAYLDREKAKKLMGESVELDEKKGDLHLYNNEADARKKAKEVGGKVIKGTGKSAGKWAVKEEIEEAVGTSAKYAGKSGMFGGKYTSKDRMMDMPLDKLNKIRSKRQAQNKAAHDKQDPKMSKMGYAKHMLDVDKADAKARKRGIDPKGKYDRYKKKNNIKDSVQVDEVLDRPGALDSYRKKADASGNKARNSATRKILTAPKDGKRPDHSDELNTMRKRNKGQDMADRVANRQFRKSIGLGYSAKKEEVEIEEAKTTKTSSQLAIRDTNRRFDRAKNTAKKDADNSKYRTSKSGNVFVGLKKEEVELDETSLYDKIKAARANPSPDKPVRGRGSKNRNPKTYDPRTALDKEDDRIQATIKKGLKKESAEVEEKKLTPKEVKRALASIKPPKKKPTLPKAPWDKKEEGYASDAQRKAVWAAKNDKKQQNESVDLSEKLSVGDGMGSWIKDFQASDAPQFAGKSDKEKRNMAIAAYLSKKRGN